MLFFCSFIVALSYNIKMKENKNGNKKPRSFIVNLILVFVVLAVTFVSFLPLRTQPIISDETVSPFYHGNKNVPNVSLMFNVYEGAQIVDGILDVLTEYKVKATFFIGGCWADDNTKTLNRIKDDGHEIGSHGYFHKDHKKLGYDGNMSEISNSAKMIKELCGYAINLFAPPSGSFSVVTLDCCADLGYNLIMWSKDTIDWRDKDENLLFSRATKNPENGDFILMHPKKHTLSVLPKIIEFYLANGFNIVTVGENIR